MPFEFTPSPEPAQCSRIPDSAGRGSNEKGPELLGEDYLAVLLCFWAAPSTWLYSWFLTKTAFKARKQQEMQVKVITE